MVKLVDSQQIKVLEIDLEAKMAAQGLLPENLRLTLVGLPVSLAADKPRLN